jgi:transposase
MRAESVNDCYVALEPSQRTWLIGYLLLCSDMVQTTAVAGGLPELFCRRLQKSKP